MFPVLSSNGPSGYTIANSLRFQSASSQYLSRTFGTATSRTTFTLNQWVKRGSLGSYQFLFDGGGSEDYIGFTNSDTIRVLLNGATIAIETSQVFRDPSAWYNILFVVDSTQATASNRMKLFINGVQVTAFGTTNYPAQNATFNFNSATSHKIGSNFATNNYFLDGYDTEIVFVDGQALTPSSFGSTDATSGQWIAKKYTGTYGTNGFYLPFSNGTSTTTLGADSSGNSNNWTLTNFTRSAGISDCWMYDVPSGNGGASGTQPNSNYPVLNVINSQSGGVTISQANLKFAAVGGATSANTYSTIGMTSGKWYCEVTALGTDVMVGIANAFDFASSAFIGSASSSWGYYRTGNKYNAGSSVAYGASYTTSDVIGIAFDADAGILTFYKNNTSQGTAFSSLASGTYFFATGNNAANHIGSINFGQRSFAYTPPTGFKALCTANLPVATIKQGSTAMNINLYTGDGTNPRTISGLSFSPDFVWVKNRSAAATDNVISDKLITDYSLFPSTTGAAAQGYIKALGTNSFDVGNPANVNGSGNSMVAWYWKAGGTGVSNTNGSITSTTSVNATAGFSVVTYTGTGANATVGHGLGVAPKMVIVKRRDTVGYNWYVYNSNLTNASYYLTLNVTAAAASDTTLWNSTAPTSSVFSLGNNAASNASTATYVAYCFAEIAGFSKFGSYTGNGSADGPFVYLGFQPKYLLVKRTDTTGNWLVEDEARDLYNPETNALYPNLSNAESSGYPCDFTANGFKLRSGTDTDRNANGGTYIYMAFATNPFANSNAR